MTKKKKGRVAEPGYLKSLGAVVDVLFAIATDDKGWTWADFAKHAGVSYTTISALGYRKTRFPEYRTIHLMAKAVGRNIEVVSKGNAKRVRLSKVA